MKIEDLITIDKDIQFGQPVFKGTRVPVETLFDHLDAGISLEIFLTDFPSVKKQQAINTLAAANRFLTSKNLRHCWCIADDQIRQGLVFDQPIK